MRIKFWTISLLVGVAAQVSLVSAVECDGDDQCVKTDFTTNKCENKICKCVDGYLATDWGCTKSLDKPTVTTLPVNNAEAFDGASVTVTCEVDTTETHSFKWFEDGSDTEVAQQSGKDYTFTIGTANKELQCSVFAGSLQVSEKSDKLTIVLLSTSGTSDSNAKPKLNLPSPGVAESIQFTPTCTGYPYGLDLTNDIKFSDESGDVTPPLQQPGDVTGKTLKCKFERTGFTFAQESDTSAFPEVITTFESASIASNEGTQTAFTTSNTPELTCETSPKKEFLPAALTISYKWSVSPTETNEKWIVPTAKEVYNDVTCTAGAGGTEKTSESFGTLTVDDDYLAEPSVTVSPEVPFKEGQMTLTCTSKDEVDEVLWERDDVVIPGQKDKIIQYTKLDVDFKAKCSVRKNGFTRESKEVQVDLADDPAKPSVTGETTVGKWGTLELTCNSTSEVPGMKYAWTRNGEAIAKATKKMYIKEEVEKTNAGKYKCSTTYGTLDAQESDEVEVKISDPGIPCTTNAQCDAADKSLTGACEEGRCVCANDYYARGDKCENGVAQAAASLLLILFAAVISRLDFV